MRHCLKKEKQINKQQKQKTGLGGEGICLRSHDELELGTLCFVLFLVGVRTLSYLNSAHPVPGWVTRRSWECRERDCPLGQADTTSCWGGPLGCPDSNLHKSSCCLAPESVALASFLIGFLSGTLYDLGTRADDLKCPSGSPIATPQHKLICIL